jgi:Flp pilus assembly protein TadB
MSARTIARWAASVAASAMVLLGVGAGISQADEQPPPVRGAMLVLDTSPSMTAAGIAAASNAALDYSRAVPEDVRVGLITFGAEPHVVTKPTTSRPELARGLSGLRTRPGTALYDAVRLGASTLDALGGAAERRLVVLSDGVDGSSAATLAAAKRLLVEKNVVADFVAFRYHPDDKSAMQQLATASGGRVLNADDARQLSGAFEEIARSAPSVGTSDDSDSGWLSWLPDWSWELYLVAGCTFGAALLLALVLFAGLGRREDSGKRVLRQIAQYGPRAEGEEAEQPKESSLARTAVGWTEGVLRSRGWEDKLAERLDLAAIGKKPAEWTVLQVCAGVVVSALLIVLGVPFLIAVPVGGLLAWAGTLMTVNVRISRRRTAFADQLPDVLQLVAGSLKSGFSLAQSLDAVVRDGTQPAAGEFARAIAETRIGVVLEDALDRVADRMDSDDLRWIVMAIRIQREVGGNLAEVLLTTVATMRERAQTRRQVRALSAEGRWSAYVLLALPIGVGGFVFWSNPDYMEPLYTTTIGVVMLVGAVIFMALGSFWMSRLIKVEV